MRRRLIVSPAAEADIQDAYDWYGEWQDGLGRRFIEELDSAFGRISEDPLSYAEILPEIRRSVLHVFPYLVFYALPEDSIEKLAKIHASQDPEYIAKRPDA